MPVCLSVYPSHPRYLACSSRARVPTVNTRTKQLPPRSAHDSRAYSPTCIPATRPAVVRAGVTKIAPGRKRELDGGEVHDTAGRGLVALRFRSELHACMQACKRQVSLCLCGTGSARLVFLLSWDDLSYGGLFEGRERYCRRSRFCRREEDDVAR